MKGDKAAADAARLLKVQTQQPYLGYSRERVRGRISRAK
jgi:hypothetical protein